MERISEILGALESMNNKTEQRNLERKNAGEATVKRTSERVNRAFQGFKSSNRSDDTSTLKK